MNKYFLKSLLLLSIILTIAVACNKQPDDVGLSVKPDSEKIDFAFDTALYVTAYSVREDSLKSDETSVSVLGSIWHPEFGITKANIVTQIRLSEVGPSWGEGAVVDSIVLSLSYSGFYGDSTSVQTVRVYEINQDLNIDSSYYSGREIDYNTTILGEKTFIARPVDSVLVDTVKVAPHIRIKLDNAALAAKFLAATADDLSSNTNWLSYFKGIYIKAGDPFAFDKGTLMYINPESSYTFLKMYYHNNTEDSLEYQFNYNAYCARFTQFDHNNYQEATPEFKAQVVAKDTTLGKEVLYLQAACGTRINLHIPELTHLLSDKNVAINEARLVLTDIDPSSKYQHPSKLVLVKLADDGTISYLEDQYEGTSYFGGSYNSSDNTYSFRITHYIQSLINNPENANERLAIYASSGAVRGYAVKLAGTNPFDPALQKKRVQIQILFTKIP